MRGVAECKWAWLTAAKAYSRVRGVPDLGGVVQFMIEDYDQTQG